MDLFGTAGGIFTNLTNMKFAKEMSSSQFQRGFEDAKAAGMNPMAMASPPSSAAPAGQSTNPVRGGELGSSVKGIADAVSAVSDAEASKENPAIAKAQSAIVSSTAKAAGAKADATIEQSKAEAAQAKVDQEAAKGDQTFLKSVAGKTVHTAKKYLGGTFSTAGKLLSQGLGNVYGGAASARQANAGYWAEDQKQRNRMELAAHKEAIRGKG